MNAHLLTGPSRFYQCGGWWQPISCRQSVNCSGSGGSYVCLAMGINATAIQNGAVAVVTATVVPEVASAAIGVTRARGSDGLFESEPECVAELDPEASLGGFEAVELILLPGMVENHKNVVTRP